MAKKSIKERLGKIKIDENVEFIDFPKNTIVEIPLELIEIGENIRDADLDTELDELGETIKEYGIIQPCPVYKKENKYVLKVGSRRYKACCALGLKTLKCIVEDNYKDDKERIIKQIIENEHRRNMTAREREEYLCQLSDMGMSNVEISRVLHKSRGEVSEAIIAHSKYIENKDNFDLIPELSTRQMYKMKDVPKETISEMVTDILGNNNLSKEEQKKEIIKKSEEYINKSKENASSEKEIEEMEKDLSENDEINSEDFSFEIPSPSDEISEEETPAEINTEKKSKENLTVHIDFHIDNDKKTFKLDSDEYLLSEIEEYVLRQIENYYIDKGFEIK